MADKQTAAHPPPPNDLDSAAIEKIIRGATGLTEVWDSCWVSYDREADVLYISLQRPQRATDSDLTDDDILLSYRDDQIVGVTVLHASKRDGLKLR